METQRAIGRISRLGTKSMISKRKNWAILPPQNETFCSVKNLVKRMKDELYSGRKYLQTAHLTKGVCQEYMKNSRNSLVGKKVQLENGQRHEQTLH